jgi:transcriptional regulator with XRE-family HTH domain
MEFQMISKINKNDKYNSVLLVTKVVGKNIRFARECRSLGVKKMAEIAGVSESTIRRIENGDPRVASGLIARVLKSLFLEKTMMLIADHEFDEVGQFYYKRNNPEIPHELDPRYDF